MADEKKKPWQFSLGRAMGAMTMICFTLAALVALWNTANEATFMAVVMSGLGSTIGAIQGGIKGAIVGATVGFMLFIAGCTFGILFFTELQELETRFF